MFGDSDFDHAKFDIEKQQEAIHRTPFAKEYEANSTDLRGFLRRGGKLLLWHGLDDVAPSPFATIDYYESTVKANGGCDIRLSSRCPACITAAVGRAQTPSTR